MARLRKSYRSSLGAQPVFASTRCLSGKELLDQVVEDLSREPFGDLVGVRVEHHHGERAFSLPQEALQLSQGHHWRRRQPEGVKKSAMSATEADQARHEERRVHPDSEAANAGM